MLGDSEHAGAVRSNVDFHPVRKQTLMKRKSSPQHQRLLPSSPALGLHGGRVVVPKILRQRRGPADAQSARERWPQRRRVREQTNDSDGDGGEPRKLQRDAMRFCSRVGEGDEHARGVGLAFGIA